MDTRSKSQASVASRDKLLSLTREYLRHLEERAIDTAGLDSINVYYGRECPTKFEDALEEFSVNYTAASDKHNFLVWYVALGPDHPLGQIALNLQNEDAGNTECSILVQKLSVLYKLQKTLAQSDASTALNNFREELGRTATTDTISKHNDAYGTHFLLEVFRIIGHYLSGGLWNSQSEGAKFVNNVNKEISPPADNQEQKEEVWHIAPHKPRT